jgi:undecaprenyl diphosphate synthase
MARGKFRQLFDLLLKPDRSSVQREREDDASPAGERAVTPYHVAIIMDGNGRWATRRHLPRGAGHRAGVEALRRIVEAAPLENVRMLTVYAFSTENWSRPQDEVEGLMDLFWDSFRRYLERLDREGVRIRHFGRMAGIRADVQEGIRDAVERTKDNDRLHLNVCLNYGSRAEIVDAVREIVAGGIPAEDVTEEMISRHLYSRDVPDPDLIIRTAGEVRLSNFLLWQSAYSEYYATQTLFPDFDRAEFARALDAYSRRTRRFGKVVPDESPDAAATEPAPSASSTSTSSPAPAH